jgi:hypothetical protein
MSNNSAGVPVLSQSGSIVNFATGFYTGDGSGSISVPLGFTPRRVKVFDSTDATTWEWNEGMAATISFKTVTGGTMTADTGSAIVTNASIVTVTEVAYGGQGAGEGTQGTVQVTLESPALGTPVLTLATGLNVSAKLYSWTAMG